jgi:hypothetical protein
MLFILITGMQMMGNMYYAYVHLEDFKSWSELFGIMEEEEIFQKRVLSIVSGAILPIIALGFIKSLVDYIRPSNVDEIKAEFEAKHAIEEELEREARIEAAEELGISEELLEAIEESAENPTLEALETEIENIQEDENLSNKEKSKKTEQKIAKVIAKNPEIKKQIEDKLREIEGEDKYTKTETPTIEGDQESEAPQEVRRITSGM